MKSGLLGPTGTGPLKVLVPVIITVVAFRYTSALLTEHGIFLKLPVPWNHYQKLAASTM